MQEGGGGEEFNHSEEVRIKFLWSFLSSGNTTSHLDSLLLGFILETRKGRGNEHPGRQP